MNGLGIYEDRGQLGHDVEMLLKQLVSDLGARDVDYAVAWAAVRRVAKEGGR